MPNGNGWAWTNFNLRRIHACVWLLSCCSFRQARDRSSALQIACLRGDGRGRESQRARGSRIGIGDHENVLHHILQASSDADAYIQQHPQLATKRHNYTRRWRAQACVISKQTKSNLVCGTKERGQFVLGVPSRVSRWPCNYICTIVAVAADIPLRSRSARASCSLHSCRCLKDTFTLSAHFGAPYMRSMNSVYLRLKHNCEIRDKGMGERERWSSSEHQQQQRAAAANTRAATMNVSNELVWSLVRSNTCFLYKRNGQTKR